MTYPRTFDQVKGTAYLVALVLGIASGILEVAFGSYTQSLSRVILLFDWIALPIVVTLGAYAVWAVLTRRIALDRLERPFALLAAVFVTAKFSITLWVAHVSLDLAYVESWYWLLLGVCLLGFLAYELRPALVQSIAVLGVTLAMHLMSVMAKSSREMLPEILPDVFASHLRLGAMIAVFAVLGYAKEQWVRFEEEATAMRYLAHVDPLTKLPNRRQLNKALSKALTQYPGAVTVIVFDVDSFKQINDEHGHLAGDQILQEIGEMAQSAVRSGDLVGRWGGEEFLVICLDSDLTTGIKVAESIRSVIEAREFPQTGPITASFGVACSKVGESPEQLVSRADRALYVSKAKGKNQVQTAR